MKQVSELIFTYLYVLQNVEIQYVGLQTLFSICSFPLTFLFRPFLLSVSHFYNTMFLFCVFYTVSDLPSHILSLVFFVSILHFL